MRRLIGLGLGLLLTVAGGRAAPRSKVAVPEPQYFPAQVGAEWVYDEGGEGAADWTWRVTSVHRKDGEAVVTVSMLSPNGYPVPLEKLAVSAKGVSVLEARNGAEMVRRDPPTCRLRLPMKAGDKWEWRTGGGEPPPCGVVGEEEVGVPAGKFRAVRIDHAPPDGRWSEWWAEGVGVVKATLPGGKVRVLKSFTRGKE